MLITPISELDSLSGKPLSIVDINVVKLYQVLVIEVVVCFERNLSYVQRSLEVTFHFLVLELKVNLGFCTLW